jgi:type I restriction enzyme S subunit
MRLLKRELEGLATGSTFKEVPRKSLRKLRIALPPLTEQEEIASILSIVDDATRMTDDIVEKSQRLKKGLMQLLLTRGIGHTNFKNTEVGEIPENWNVRRIGEICESIVPGRNKPKKFGGDIPWITVKDIDGMYLDFSKAELNVSEEEVRRSGGKIVPANSVVMTCVGELGIVAIAKRKIVINQQLHAFVCPGYLDPYFLAVALISQKNYMLSTATTTVVRYLNKDNCESIPVPLPPVEEQREIVKILEESDRKIQNERSIGQDFQQLKKGLMQSLLTGEVRVKVN